MAEPDHTTEPLTLETAIERTGRPLKPLFEAAAAWRAAPPILILDDRIGVALRPRIAYERELGEITAHFIRLLATRALAIQVRPWDQLGGRLRPVRPGDASQLSIKVDPSGESLTLHGPAGERLFYELSAPAPGASAPKKAAAEPAKRPRRYGPLPETFERVLTEMRAMDRDELRAMKQEQMRAIFRASADTCYRARNKVLSELSELSESPNSD
jgi:hypothetical protein